MRNGSHAIPAGHGIMIPTIFPEESIEYNDF